MRLDVPLLLDGDIAAGWEEIPGDCCPAGVIWREEETLLRRLSAHREAGAQVLRAPTGGASLLALSEYELTGQARTINESLVRCTRRAAGEAPVAGVLASARHAPEPFGPLPLTDLIDTYAEQAIELAQSGADLLVLQEMHALEDMRAAVLGARQAGLPLLLCMEADAGPEGERERCDPLAALLCLQELGLDAFGLRHGDREEAARLLKRLAPYARVPLIAGLSADGDGPEELARTAFELMAAGARILMGGGDVTPDHIRALRDLVDSFDPEAYPLPSRSDGAPLMLTNAGRAYYLEEDFAASHPIDCETDMSKAILEAEDAGADLLLCRVESIGEAYQLGQNAFMADTPVGILAAGEESLEMALLYYQGRALVDSRSVLSREQMKTLAAGYGAIVR